MRIRMKGIYKFWEGEFGKIRVLENVNLDIADKEFIAIMGPSGTGKSTFLHLLGCIDKPNFGEIYLDNTDICKIDENIREQIRLEHIGFIFQNYYLIPTLSVLENVTLPMQLANSFIGQQEERAMKMLELVGIQDKWNYDTAKLSGGQRQRVATARALVNEPGLLLADEPTGNLDAKSTREVMDMLKIVNRQQGLTTVMVTHDSKVAAYADKIYYLDEGRLSTANI